MACERSPVQVRYGPHFRKEQFLGEEKFWVHSVNVVENFLPLQVIDLRNRRNAVARSKTD